MSWSEGYIADVAYTSGVYLETAPAHLSTCALLAGFRGPDPSRPFRYLELGCGTGMGVCLMAAANPNAEFVGVDFNPTHVAIAARLIDQAGLTNARVVEASFADLATSDGAEFGQFDYAIAHGVWTWIGPSARSELVAALDRRVAPGGLVYMGYNNMAGWAGSLSLQRLIADHARRVPGDSLAKIRAAVRFALEMRKSHPRGIDFSRLELQMKGALDDPDKAPVGLFAYLAHEYLNEHWEPVFPGDLARDLAGAKLTFIGRADPFSVMPELLSTQAEANAAQTYPDARGAALLADLLAPTSFRQDIFLRGATPLSPQRREAALRSVRLASAAKTTTDPLTLDVPSGQLELDEVAYRPVLERLEAGPASVENLMAVVSAADRRMSPTELLAILVGSGMATPSAGGTDGALLEGDRDRARRYNIAMIEALRDQAGLRLALACPLTGSGVKATMAECLAYLTLVLGTDRHPELDTTGLRRTAAENEGFWRELGAL